MLLSGDSQALVWIHRQARRTLCRLLVYQWRGQDSAVRCIPVLSSRERLHIPTLTG